MVAGVDLQSPAVAEQIATCKQHPKFVGVRHITQDEPDDDFIIRPAYARAQALEKARLPFDLLFFVKHLKHAATVAQSGAELPLVIDHLAKPKIKSQSIDDLLPHFKASGRLPERGLQTFRYGNGSRLENWKPSDLQPYVDHALELFGPERLMYGSDWPVCELAGSYEPCVSGVGKNAWPSSARARGMRSTAARRRSFTG